MADVIRGLEGVLATETKVSSIVGQQLTYAGYDIDDLTENAKFEEVIFLLWHFRLPNEQELNDFKAQLLENMVLNPRIYEHFEDYAADDVHPMTGLRTSLSYLAHFDPRAEEFNDDAHFNKATRIQAKVASLVAAFARVRQGKEPLKPKAELSYAANFLYMLFGEVPTEVQEEAFNKALILHADHELNASTFTARVCVSTLTDMYSGVTAAAGALKGPLHGGANEQVMKMLSEIGSMENVEDYIQKKIDNKEKIMGFGHRVYKEGDPRAKYLKEMSRRITDETGQKELYEMSVRIAEIMEEKKGLLPNVDFYSATVYHSMGIEHDLFTPIFAVSRVSGWLAHILEQYENNRIIRPRAEYVGEVGRKYVPVSERK
ncbi:citrate synthase [Macrococcus bovicus]|uniref:citrate synthase n=1 Tax=Macrococcus bovicus TaxID=69968 RepID=UPI0025A5BCD1|nr:citrate synthase [Macrococcus bovicus]WJP97166.1 citrate synthase [Macrococcus bovicus]